MGGKVKIYLAYINIKAVFEVIMGYYELKNVYYFFYMIGFFWVNMQAK